MNRIDAKFAEVRERGQKAFIPYLTVGDPDLETTLELILELERRGSDVIELGVPFSDPMADGPVIQRAMERALAHRSVGVRDCLEMMGELRRRSQIPVVLFSYLNPLVAYGLERIGSALAEAGIDGVLATDLVPEEAAYYRRMLEPSGIDMIFLVAPTSTDERIRLAADASTGFVYAVSRTGVTGARQTLSGTAADLADRVRACTNLPVALGFGISTPEQVAEVWRHADGAVVGSKIVSEIANHSDRHEMVKRVGELTGWLLSSRTAAATPRETAD